MGSGDRLSGLPNHLIQKILSFLDISEVVEMSVLSRSWRSIWLTMPYLNFLYGVTLREFSKCVTNVLSRRDNQTFVYSEVICRGYALQHGRLQSECTLLCHF
ncbi:putative F-box domain-containing protein [Helianthus annuus]|nr:putative F-box domain-containing protein [Helianthus annuus]